MDGFHVAARLRAEHPDTFKLLRLGGGGAVFRTPAISNTQLSEQSVEFWDAGVADSDHQGESRQTHFHKRHYLVQCILREHWSGVLLTRYSRPTLELDRRGRLVQVNFNNQVRSCQLPCQGEAGVSDVYYSYYSGCMFRCGLHQAAVQGPQALQHGEQLQIMSDELYLLRYIYIIYSVISTLSISRSATAPPVC